ncbi:MAG: hypothetical protein QW156_01705 [Candidatus Aenigmatarchaeota archaeon]
MSDQSINQSPINQSIVDPEEISSEIAQGPPPIPTESTTTSELVKDYFQLGLAAGYTGRSLKEIEVSLSRIEAQMATKDWVNVQFTEKLQEIIEILRKHEENEQQRFEALKNIILSGRLFEVLPESKHSTTIIPSLPIEIKELTPRMKELLEIVKQHKEISYKDLAIALRITENGLRGLLSSVCKLTTQVQRFERDGRGWVRYVSSG